MTELTIEHEGSIRKAAITAVTGIIAELRCGHAAPVFRRTFSRCFGCWRI